MQRPNLKKPKILENGEVLISWRKHDEKNKFIIKRSEDEEGVYETLATVDSDDGEFIDSNVEMCKLYWYKVIAYKVVNQEKKFKRSFPTKAFTYIKQNITIDSVKQKDENHVTIKWQPLNSADAYALFKRNEHGSIPVLIKKIDKQFCQCDDEIILGTVNYYTIKAICVVDDSDVYIAESEQYMTASIGKTEILQCKQQAMGKVCLKLRIVSGASGYVIERKDDNETEFKEIARTNTNVEYEFIDKPKKAKKSIYQAKAYKILGDEILISAASEMKSVK